VILKACGHQFCYECIKQWIQNKPACPLCSVPIETLHTYTLTDGSEDSPSATTDAESSQLSTTNQSDNTLTNIYTYKNEAIEQNINKEWWQHTNDEFSGLDHNYFIGEVDRMLQSAIKLKNSITPSHRLENWEKSQLETSQVVIVQLQCIKDMLLAYHRFEPSQLMQDLLQIETNLQHLFLHPAEMLRQYQQGHHSQIHSLSSHSHSINKQSLHSHRYSANDDFEDDEYDEYDDYYYENYNDEDEEDDDLASEYNSKMKLSKQNTHVGLMNGPNKQKPKANAKPNSKPQPNGQNGLNNKSKKTSVTQGNGTKMGVSSDGQSTKLGGRRKK